MRNIKSTMMMSALVSLGIAGLSAATAAEPRYRGGADTTVQRESGGDRYDRGGRGGDYSERAARGNDAVIRGGDRARSWREPKYSDHIRRGHRYSWGPGVAFYFTDGYYYGECQWLKRRAIETGSRVWWRRYERCRDFN